ncbi:MAG: hypothetical protein JOZ69_01305 [Myxococcales bacterium]|nr:hypothetical protein [Myxococcales bacterium]
MKERVIIAMIGLASGLGACHSEPPPQGPAEKAGRSVDNAARDTKDAVQDSKEDVKRDMKK